MKAAAGTHEGDELTPAPEWEIVEVWENHIGTDCEANGEKWAVSVCGVEQTQWPRDFIWLEMEPLEQP